MRKVDPAGDDRRTADPIVRFAYALREDPDEGYQRLVEALPVEPLAVVRQAIGRRLAMAERPPLQCVPEVLRCLREGAPEALLALVRGQPRTDSQPSSRPFRSLPPELAVLVALAAQDDPDLVASPITTHPAEAALAALGMRGRRHPLARAYQSGIAEKVALPSGGGPAVPVLRKAQLLRRVRRAFVVSACVGRG